jgi:hypothetical protein
VRYSSSLGASAVLTSTVLFAFGCVCVCVFSPGSDDDDDVLTCVPACVWLCYICFSFFFVSQ